MSDNIKVAIKVRPLITREKDENLSEQWIIQENSLKPKTYTSSNEIFYFDNVFDTTSSNSDVYNAVVAPITAAAVNGFNGTIFAYGQTSSGKTYTMTGAKQEYGIVQLVINDIFKLIANHSNREFLLRASFIEIYNEKINDLLDSDNSKKDGNKASINIYEEDGVVKLNVKEEISDTPTNLMDIMRRGEKNRVIGETNMNERSSRSHTIFRIIIESRDSNTNDPDGAIQVAHLNLVDLAGSERVSQTGAKGVRLREGAHINKSLFILSHVINQLSESTDATKYISFRDSKLTRILQSSLGGNAKTVIICAITPASLDETTSTLMFASRAKSIKNKPKVNEIVSNDTLLKRYAKQISILKDQLEREQKEKENNQEEYSLANRRLQERIFLLQKFMLRPQVTPIKQMLPTIGSLVPESIDKTIRRQTWCASAKSLFSLPKLPQGVLAEDLYVPLLRNKFNDMTLNNSSSFISGENFEFENVFNFDNSLLLKEGNIQHENESVPMEPFELELIASVKNKVNETLTTLPPLDVTTVNRKSEENECEIENLKTKLNYYKTEYETLKEFVGDENTILNVRIDELEKYNKEILIDNVKLQDLLNTKDSEIKSLNIKLSGYSSANPLLGSETIDTAITRLLRKKDEILEIKNDISKQIISYNVQDVDKNTDYLKRLHNEFTEVFKVLDMNSKVVHTMQRLNNHYKTTLQNIKLPRNKLGTIDEDEDCEEYLDTIQEIMEDTLRLRTHIHDMSAQIEYLQKHNHLLVSEYEKLRDEFSTKIKDQINDSKKLQNTIDILKSEKLDLEQKHIKSIEFIKQIEQEKEFWEELQRKNKTLKQQIDSLQETKNDFDQKLKNLEETYLTQIQETTNEFQVKVNSLETSNITLENEVKFLKENNQSLEINNKDIKNDYNEIKMLHSNFYQELQKLTNQFEKLILKTSFYDDGNISENSKESKLLAQYRNLIECTEKYLQNEDNIKYELENKISNLTSQISKFESKDDQKYCNSDNKEKEIQRLKEIEEEKNSLIKELKMKGLQIFELENQIESVKNVNITHDEILCQKEALIMKNKIEKLESSENLTRKEFEDLKEELNLKNFKISELEEEIQKIKHINVEQNDKSNDQQEIQNNSEASQSEFLKEELKMKNLKIFELEEEIEEIKQFNLEQNQDIVNHQKEIDVLIKKLESSELKTKDLAPKISLINDLEENLSSTKEEIKLKDFKILELDKQIEEMKQINSEQIERIYNFQEENRSTKKELEELQLKNKELTEKSELLNELEDSVSVTKEELNLKDLKISELDKQIEDMKQINSEQIEQISNYQEEMRSTLKKLEELELKNKEFTEKSKLLNELESSISVTKEELKLKDLKISELDQQIEDMKQINSEQIEQISNYQEEMRSTLKKLEELELKNKEFTEKSKLLNELESSISVTKEELKLKDLKISELDQQIEDMKQINSEQIERINNFDEENRSTKKELEELQLKNKELTEKSELLNELEDSVSVTKEELKLKDLKISELDKQIEDMKQINSEQIERINNFHEENRSTIKELEELELKNKEFTEKSELLNELEDSLSITKEELKLKDLKISELDKQIEDMKQINSEQIEQISNYQEEMRSTLKKLEELELKNKEFTEKSKLLNELESSISVTKEELKLKDLKISELDQQIEDMKQINSEQNECIYNYQEEICSKIREFEELQLKNKELTEKAVVINELENFISVTREELKLKNSKMLELKKQIEKMKQINLEQNERMRNYQEEISSTKGRLELDSLNEQLELKNLKILELEKQIQDNDQEKMNGMIKKLNESELKCKDLAQKIVLIKDLENSISSTKKELKFKDLKIFELEKQITEMKQVNLEQNRGMSNCQEEIRCTIEKLEELQFKNKEIAEKSTMIKELEDSLNSTKEEIKLKELKIMELENQLEEIKQVNLVQNDRINTYQEAIQNTMVKLEELELKDQILTEKSAVIKDLENKVNLITQELNSKNLIISELENQIDEIKQINLEQNRRIINYNETDEEKMQYLKNKFEEINIKYNNLQENYLKLETEKKTLQDQISSVISDQNKNVTEIEKKYKDSEENYKSKIQKLMKEKEQLANNYMILKKNYKDARCEVLLINAKLTTLENQYKEKETAWEQSELKIKQLEMEQQNEQEIKNLKEIIKNSNDRKDYLEKKLLKKHESNQSIKQELESKKKMITNLEKLNTELEKNLTSKNIIIQNLEQKLNEDNESLKQELETKHNIILSLESTIKKLENLNHEIKENHISQEETIRNLNQNIETLEQKNYNFEKNSKSLKQDLESKNNIISKLESKIVELKKLNQEQKDNLMLSQTTLEKVTIDFENNIKSLKQDLGSKNIISKLESKIVELEKLNQEQKDNLILSQTTLEKMTVGFENNIKSLKQDFESKNIAISKLETKIVELETLNQEQKENLNSSQTTLEKVTIDFENNIKSLKKALEAKNITISKLETTIVELEKSNQEQKENLISSQTTLEKVKINFENNIKSLNEELQSKCIAILNLESKILDLEKIKQKQKDNLNSQTTLKINTIDFENNIKLLKQELESKNMIISNLETKIYNLEKSEKRNLDQIQQCSKEIEISNRITLEETVDKMKKRIRDLQRKLMDADQEKKLLKNRLERQVQQNDELAETFNIQLSTEAEFLEKEIEQKNDAIKKLENDKGELIGQLQNLKNQIGLKDKTLENLNKDLNIKEKLIIDLNNKLLPLKNHNSPLKENYNKYEFDYKMEIQKLTKEKNRFMQISQMNSKELKKIHQKLKDKEESEIKLKLLLEEIKEENTILVKKNNELIQNEENRCENCSKMNDNYIQTINLNKQLELELMSLKTENEMNIEKIHQLEDKISELRSSDHRSTTPTPNTGRKNRLSTSKRNELFDEARRNRMENELNSAQQCLTDNSSNTISMPPILKCDRSIQVDIFELGYGHGSGIVTEYHYDKKLREITKKKEFYKELAVLRKTNLKKLEDQLCDTCRRNK